MLSFKDYCKLNEGQTALHLLPPAGISRKVLKGKSDFDAHIAANATGAKKQRGGDGRTYHIKNGRVHGVWNSEAGTGVVYASSKNESEVDEAASTDNLPISNVHKHIATLAVKIRPAQYDEQEELDEGSIANIEQKLKDHAKRKIDHEAKFGQMNGADLHSHEVTRTRLLQQKKKLQSAKMRAESVELEEVDEGAPIVVPFAHSLKQAADQRKQLAADKEKLRASIVTPYQLGKKHKAEGKQNSNPHKFVKSAGAAGNYEHNAYNRGFNESTELDESGWIGGIAKWKEACKKNGLTTGHNQYDCLA